KEFEDFSFKDFFIQYPRKVIATILIIDNNNLDTYSLRKGIKSLSFVPHAIPLFSIKSNLKNP
ncbi:MAG: hypothetical protein VYD48_01915, partial [Bacteroidota bacterium]|nr:hypothetical protein [Bacteroidota bacterium]